MATQQRGKTIKGFVEPRNVRSPGLLASCGVLFYAWYKMQGDRISYSRFLHRYDECPDTAGLVKDNGMIMHDSTAPWKMCPKCTKYMDSLRTEERRRMVASGAYRHGENGTLIHVECGRERNRCSCFDI